MRRPPKARPNQALSIACGPCRRICRRTAVDTLPGVVDETGDRTPGGTRQKRFGQPPRFPRKTGEPGARDTRAFHGEAIFNLETAVGWRSIAQDVESNGARGTPTCTRRVHGAGDAGGRRPTACARRPDPTAVSRFNTAAGTDRPRPLPITSILGEEPATES